jgi:hypothetical protein
MGRNEWREVPEERLVGICAFDAVWTLETAVVLTVRKWRKEGSMDQPRFSVVHIACTIPYTSVPHRMVVGAGTHACVGCTLAITGGKGLVRSSLLYQRGGNYLRVFLYALGRSAEKSAHALCAVAMYSRPLQAFLRYLRRCQARSHSRDLQLHECSNR